MKLLLKKIVQRIFVGILTLGVFSSQASANFEQLIQAVSNWGNDCLTMGGGVSECARLTAISNALTYDVQNIYSPYCPLDGSYYEPLNATSFQMNAQQYLDSLKSASKALKDWEPRDIYDLVKCVENSKSGWKQQCELAKSQNADLPIGMCQLENAKTQVSMEFDDHCDRLFVGLGKKIGQGNFKRFDEALEYRTWERAARGSLREDKMPQPGLPPEENARRQFGLMAEKKHMEKEGHFLRSINAQPDQRRVGLPLTYYADSNRILQPRYDGDMSQVGASNASYQAMSQLSRGVENLHEIGLIHGDIKPANNMIKNATDPVEVRAIVSDFGQAFPPSRFLNRPKLAVGDREYLAPDAWDPQWIGKTDDEKIANAKKADVFSHALSLVSMLPTDKTDQFPVAQVSQVYRNCAKTIQGPPQRNKCAVPLGALRALLNKRKNDPAAALLAKGLDPNLPSRPSSAEFRTQMDTVVSSKLVAEATTTVSQVDSKIGNRFKMMTTADAEKSLGKAISFSSGKYYVIPTVDPRTGTHHFKMGIRKGKGAVDWVDLASNPFDPQALITEIQQTKAQHGIP